MRTLNLPDLKAQAVGRSRPAAAEVLIPTVLAATDVYGTSGYGRSLQMMQTVAQTGAFRLCMLDCISSMYYSVTWREALVMTAHVCPDRSGTYLDRRVHVMSWRRGGHFRGWQAELLDTFDLGGYRPCPSLLTLEPPGCAVFELLCAFYDGEPALPPPVAGYHGTSSRALH